MQLVGKCGISGKSDISLHTALGHKSARYIHGKLYNNGNINIKHKYAQMIIYECVIFYVCYMCMYT